MTIAQFLLLSLAIALMWAIVPAITWMAAGRRAALFAAKQYAKFFAALFALMLLGAVGTWVALPFMS